MNRRTILILASLFFLMPIALRAADDKHEDDTKKAAPRASAEKKKPSTLAEKINACLADRPGATKKGDGAAASTTKPDADAAAAPATGASASSAPAAAAAPQSTETASTAGPALFTQYCSKCHADGVNGGQAIGKLNAGEMPPATEPQPSAQEKQALIEHFSRQK